jgi:hypothetical protein
MTAVRNRLGVVPVGRSHQPTAAHHGSCQITVVDAVPADAAVVRER